MTIRLSCNDYAWPMLGHRAVLAVISDLGFEGVDIGLFAEATHVKLSSVREAPERRAAEVAADVDQAGLRVADVFLTSSMEIDRLTPTARADDDVDQLRSIFRSTVAFAAQLEAPGVTLLPGIVADGQSVSQAIALAAEGLAPLVETGAERGLGVSIEPHVGSCVETPEATLELLERCPGLTVTLDPSHFMFGGCSTDRMTLLAEHSRHVQIRPAGPGVMQAKVRDNQIDLGQIVAALRAVGYDGWIASEFVWMQKWACDEVDNTSESALLREVLSGLVGGSDR